MFLVNHNPRVRQEDRCPDIDLPDAKPNRAYLQHVSGIWLAQHFNRTFRSGETNNGYTMRRGTR